MNRNKIESNIICISTENQLSLPLILLSMFTMRIRKGLPAKSLYDL